jgi:hypothetical protein
MGSRASNQSGGRRKIERNINLITGSMPVDSGTLRLLIELGAGELWSCRNSHHESSVTLDSLFFLFHRPYY